MNKIPQILVLVFSLMILPASGHSEIIDLEKAIEAMTVVVDIDKSLNGSITATTCRSCPVARLKINKDTQAIHNGKTVHLYSVKSLTGKGATVIYNPKTKTVNKIIW